MIRRTVVAALAVSLLGVPAPVAAAVACPEIIVHRTNPLAAPENTVEGIATVPATGAKAVEVDVRWSSTNFPVLMHDRTVDRTTNGTGAPDALGLGQLMALKAQDYAPWKTDARFASTRVPYGYEFMDAVRAADLDLLAEVPDPPRQADMAKLEVYVNDYFGWTARTRIMGSAISIKLMRQWQPGFRYVLIEYPAADTVRSGESLRALGVVGYAVPNKAITPAAVAYWQAYGISVLTWTSDPGNETPAVWRQMRDAGVDSLITNEPGRARAEICS